MKRTKTPPRRFRTAKIAPTYEQKFEAERKIPPIQPLTTKQALYLDALRSSEQVIALGVAGTGKTWVAATYAADLLRTKKIGKIIITKPNVPGGRSIGFLPGTADEKMAPWVAPITAAIRERIGAGAYDIAIKNEDIEIVPFETMRGRTFKDAYVILSEAQNTTVEEMKLFLTRVGEDSQVVIDGDLAQKDLKETSGLSVIINMIKADILPIPVIEFEIGDIVRSGVCAMWVKAFHKRNI